MRSQARIFILSGCFFLLCMACSAQTFDDLAAWSRSDGALAALDDPKIQASLKNLLGQDFDEFADNFDVVAPPNRLADGGVFFEGWRRDLRLYQASAFVVKPDGRIYAGFLTPGLRTIKYRTSDRQGKGAIEPAMAAWIQRFHDVRVDR